MRFLRYLTLALTMSLVISGCSLFTKTQAANEEAFSEDAPQQEFATAQTPPTADVGPDAIAEAKPAKAPEAQSMLPNDFELVQLYDFELTSGEFPDDGATLNFTLDEPTQEGQMATIARWLPDEELWEPLETEISADGTKLSARTEHFSEYGVVLNWVEKLDLKKRIIAGDATNPPTCKSSPLTGKEPDWSEMQFFEDKLSPTLWCVTGIETTPDEVVVKLVWSRGTSAKITTALTPLAVDTDMFFSGASSFLMTNLANAEVAINRTGKEFVVQPLGQYAFKFDRKSLNELYNRSPETPLIQVETNMGFVAMGLAYDEIQKAAGPAAAGIMLFAGSTDCAMSLTSEDVESAINMAIGCLGTVAGAGEIGQKLLDAGRLKNSDALTNLAEVGGKAAKRLENLLAWYKIGITTQKLVSVLGDSFLSDITRKMTYTPSPTEVINIVRQRQTRQLEQCDKYDTDFIFHDPEMLSDGDCKVLPPVTFTHPKYGESHFFLGAVKSGDTRGVSYWLTDTSGKVLQKRSSEDYAGYYVSAPQMDGSGNITYLYNPGRDDACVALKPKDDWFEGFGTDPQQVPEGTMDYATKFYGCEWLDEDNDGTKEILYRPGFGMYDIRQPILFKWDGNDYIEDRYYPFPDGSYLPGFGPDDKPVYH